MSCYRRYVLRRKVATSPTQVSGTHNGAESYVILFTGPCAHLHNLWLLRHHPHCHFCPIAESRPSLSPGFSWNCRKHTGLSSELTPTTHSTSHAMLMTTRQVSSGLLGLRSIRNIDFLWLQRMSILLATRTRTHTRKEARIWCLSTPMRSIVVLICSPSTQLVSANVSMYLRNVLMSNFVSGRPSMVVPLKRRRCRFRTC